MLSPCLRAEQIHITVDTHTGMLRCHVPKHLDSSVVPELQTALNSDLNKLQPLVSELRYWITKRRCEKTLQHLPAASHLRLPLLNSTAIANIGRHKVFVKLHRHSNIILVSSMHFLVEIFSNANSFIRFIDCGTQGKGRKSVRNRIQVLFDARQAYGNRRRIDYGDYGHCQNRIGHPENLSANSIDHRIRHIYRYSWTWHCC